MKPDQLYHVHHGDCIEHMLSKMPPESVDFSVFSPPFPQVFAYSNSESDLGNSENLAGEAKLHFSWFFRAMLRVLKRGRVMVVHCAQIHRSKRDNEQGVFDFRGMLIRLAERAGFVFEYDWIVRKNPQAQAIRGKKWELKFQGLETDRSISRGAMPDYLLKFRVPGKNSVAIDSANQVSRNDWIKWAECCWSDISETDTLNAADGRSKDDVKHIAPLQLEVIRRLILLYTNPGEIVFSPFAGIGSELFMALGGIPKPKADANGNALAGKRIFDQRRAYGCELKDEYHATAIRNCERAIREHSVSDIDLFADQKETA